VKILISLIYIFLFWIGVFDTYPPLKINLKSNSAQEIQTKRQLVALIKRYDLAPYIYTRSIEIDETAKPHSHPVLTLGVKYRSQPLSLLSLLIHEQLHWFFANPSHEGELKKFVATMRGEFSEAAIPRAEEEPIDTYVHLGLCFYELEILKKLVGDEEALRQFSANPTYPWVREQVVKQSTQIKKALEESGLTWRKSDLFL
jgi:hypothetical protein